MRRIGDFGILVATVAGAGVLLGAMASAQGAQTTAVPRFGNPDGHFPVPAAGRAVDTSHPNHVIGHGTPASRTSAAVVRVVAKGGIIKFNCGPKPVTILMNATARVPKVKHLVVIDGGGLVTLSGGHQDDRK